MAEVYDLKANVRTNFGKGAARKLRVTNHIPAVVYGHGGETQHVALPAHELTLLVRHKNVLIDLPYILGVLALTASGCDIFSNRHLLQAILPALLSPRSAELECLYSRSFY